MANKNKGKEKEGHTPLPTVHPNAKYIAGQTMVSKEELCNSLESKIAKENGLRSGFHNLRLIHEQGEKQGKVLEVQDIPSELREKLPMIMPGLRFKSCKEFWEYEWAQHGCKTRLPVPKYFQTIADMDETYNLARAMRQVALVQNRRNSVNSAAKGGSSSEPSTSMAATTLQVPSTSTSQGFTYASVLRSPAKQSSDHTSKASTSTSAAPQQSTWITTTCAQLVADLRDAFGGITPIIQGVLHDNRWILSQVFITLDENLKAISAPNPYFPGLSASTPIDYKL